MLTVESSEAEGGNKAGLLTDGNWYNIIHQEVPQRDTSCIGHSLSQVKPLREGKERMGWFTGEWKGICNLIGCANTVQIDGCTCMYSIHTRQNQYPPVSHSLTPADIPTAYIPPIPVQHAHTSHISTPHHSLTLQQLT